MENEKFQNMVLEHLAGITQEITETRNELKEFKAETNQRKYSAYPGYNRKST